MSIGRPVSLSVWRIGLPGRHLLIAGRTNAGKSGWVRLVVIDLKGGMEFAAREPLFTRFPYADSTEFAAALDRGTRQPGRP